MVKSYGAAKWRCGKVTRCRCDGAELSLARNCYAPLGDQCVQGPASVQTGRLQRTYRMAPGFSRCSSSRPHLGREHRSPAITSRVRWRSTSGHTPGHVRHGRSPCDNRVRPAWRKLSELGRDAAVKVLRRQTLHGNRCGGMGQALVVVGWGIDI